MECAKAFFSEMEQVRGRLQNNSYKGLDYYIYFLGVGKGRQLAGIVLDNWSHGRHKHVWLSASSDLQFDARRDLDDIGAAHIPTSPLMKISAVHSIPLKSGVLFSTYSTLIAVSKSHKKPLSRLEQIIKWCGPNFEGCILLGR